MTPALDLNERRRRAQSRCGPPCAPVDILPPIVETAETGKSMRAGQAEKTFGPDELPAELLKPVPDEDRDGNRCIMGQLHDIEVPGQGPIAGMSGNI